jgi:predicted Zn-dependent peptidase
METSRLLLVVVGDLDPNQVRQKVEASFGKLPRGNYRPQALPQLSFSAFDCRSHAARLAH